MPMGKSLIPFSGYRLESETEHKPRASLISKPNSEPIKEETGSLRLPEHAIGYAQNQRYDPELLNVLPGCNEPA